MFCPRSPAGYGSFRSLLQAASNPNDTRAIRRKNDIARKFNLSSRFTAITDPPVRFTLDRIRGIPGKFPYNAHLMAADGCLLLNETKHSLIWENTWDFLLTSAF